MEEEMEVDKGIGDHDDAIGSGDNKGKPWQRGMWCSPRPGLRCCQPLPWEPCLARHGRLPLLG